jgi:hypothetical protein
MTSFYILAFFHGLVCAAGDELSNVASLSSSATSSVKTWYRDSVFRVRLSSLPPLSSCHGVWTQSAGYLWFWAQGCGSRKEEGTRRTGVLTRSDQVSVIVQPLSLSPRI